MSNTIHDTLLNLHSVLERLETRTGGKLTIAHENHYWILELRLHVDGIGITQVSRHGLDFDRVLEEVMELLDEVL